MEKKIRIYIETSIISHLDATDRPDWMKETLLLWKELQAGRYEAVVGAPVMAELEKCHEPKRTFMFEQLDKIKFDLVAGTDESKRIASEYISLGGLPRKSRTDAAHIALATLANCDVIVSWNFSHIVNFKAMTAVDTVNTHERLKPIRIVSPTILLGGKKGE